MKRLILACLLALIPAAVLAQVPANPTGLEFTSPDQTTVIPAGQTNAGQPTLGSYQVSIFKAADNPSAGVPVVVGPVVPKAQAALQPAGTYRLTFAQLGATAPACTALPCPQYTAVLVAIGPNGTSALAVASESNPFTATLPVQGLPPAAPGNVKVF